jgi:hypothetical protein
MNAIKRGKSDHPREQKNRERDSSFPAVVILKANFPPLKLTFRHLGADFEELQSNFGRAKPVV